MKPDITKLNKIAEAKYFPLIFIPLAFLFVLVYSLSTSPLYVHEGWDSNIFKEIGLAITRGKLLYVDIFDHKGPVIFLIDALGQLMIPGRLGIFILQVIAMSGVLVYLYKMARLFLNGILSFVSVMATLVIFSGIYYEGNLTEEWGLIAVVISMYYAIRYLKTASADKNSPTPHSCWLSVVYGVCFSYIFYMRPNDAVATVGGVMFGIFVFLLYTRQYKCAINNALCFVGTFIVLSIPFFAYFASKNALDAYWYGMITHNSMYTNGFLPLVKSCFGKKKLMFFLLFLAINVMAYNTKYRNVMFILVPISLFAWVLTGWLMFVHYAIPYIPLFLLFWVFMFKQKGLSIPLLSLAIMYCSSFGGQLDFLYGIRKDTAERIHQIKTKDQDNREFYAECKKLIDVIPEDERDQIWNLNLIWDRYPLCSIFFHNGLVQCNKVMHYPHYAVDPALKEQDNIWTGNPKWILMTHVLDKHLYYHFDFTRDYEYIAEHYEYVAETDPAICNIVLYRRK